MDHPPSPERAAFDQGLASGRDPVNAAALAGGVGVTNLRSPWLQRPCLRCGHTFRRGDRVEVQPGASYLHASGTSFCVDTASTSTAAPADATSSPTRNAFYLGLARACPPPPGAPVVRLEPGHPLLAPPTPAFARSGCAVCGHSFRPFDHVVVCPCSPDDPLCRSAVHRDPIRLMMCWDEWRKSHLGSFCPVTSRRLPAPGEGSDLR
jgi:hypothetical protein